MLKMSLNFFHGWIEDVLDSWLYNIMLWERLISLELEVAVFLH